jgi:Leucine-rich repeat (LRR) protein
MWNNFGRYSTVFSFFPPCSFSFCSTHLTALHAYPQLRRLSLAKNQLTYLPDTTFAPVGLGSFELLDLSGNRLQNLPQLIMPALNILDVSQNDLFALDTDVFDALVQLRILDLYMNS